MLSHISLGCYYWLAKKVHPHNTSGGLLLPVAVYFKPAFVPDICGLCLLRMAKSKKAKSEARKARKSDKHDKKDSKNKRKRSSSDSTGASTDDDDGQVAISQAIASAFGLILDKQGLMAFFISLVVL